MRSIYISFIFILALGFVAACGGDDAATTNNGANNQNNTNNADPEMGQNNAVDMGTDLPQGDCAEASDCAASPNATASCVEGVCEYECSDGFDDCNDDLADGCEVDLSDPANCGSCQNMCPERPDATAVCEMVDTSPTCGITCNDGQLNCDSDAVTGCETSSFDLNNCGACGNQCPNFTYCAGDGCRTTNTTWDKNLGTYHFQDGITALADDSGFVVTGAQKGSNGATLGPFQTLPDEPTEFAAGFNPSGDATWILPLPDGITVQAPVAIGNTNVALTMSYFPGNLDQPSFMLPTDASSVSISSQGDNRQCLVLRVNPRGKVVDYIQIYSRAADQSITCFTRGSDGDAGFYLGVITRDSDELFFRNATGQESEITTVGGELLAETGVNITSLIRFDASLNQVWTRPLLREPSDSGLAIGGMGGIAVSADSLHIPLTYATAQQIGGSEGISLSDEGDDQDSKRAWVILDDNDGSPLEAQGIPRELQIAGIHPIPGSDEVLVRGTAFGSFEVFDTQVSIPSANSSDAFIARVAPSMGFEARWVTTFGGSAGGFERERPVDIKIRESDQTIYVAGDFNSGLNVGPYSFTGPGDEQYIVSLAEGGEVRWAETWGGKFFQNSPDIDFLEEQLIILGTSRGETRFMNVQIPDNNDTSRITLFSVDDSMEVQ